MNKLCGFRPSGSLHLGHYFSIIKPGQCGATVLIANYHAPEYDQSVVLSNAALLKSFGVANILYQTDIFNEKLYFRLLNLAKIGDLSRMTQYRACPEDERTAHLLTYPVLMAHDVVGFDEILVGEDQVQHLEYARKLLRKCNNVHQTKYPIPRINTVAGRIKDLRDPTKKMSKSMPLGCLFLNDTPDDIRSKLRKAVPDENGLENLKFLYKEFVGNEIPESNQTLKESLANAIISAFNKEAI